MRRVTGGGPCQMIVCDGTRGVDGAGGDSSRGGWGERGAPRGGGDLGLLDEGGGRVPRGEAGLEGQGGVGGAVVSGWEGRKMGGGRRSDEGGTGGARMGRGGVMGQLDEVGRGGGRGEGGGAGGGGASEEGEGGGRPGGSGCRVHETMAQDRVTTPTATPCLIEGDQLSTLRAGENAASAKVE